MKLKNHEKALVLKLLEKERFRIMQHAIDLKKNKEIDLENWATNEAKLINGIISVLNLNIRDTNEVIK